MLSVHRYSCKYDSSWVKGCYRPFVASISEKLTQAWVT